MNLRPRAAWLVWLLVFLAVGSVHAQTPQAVATIVHAQAVPAGWQSAAPPATGWVSVKLLDYWNKRWPRHDGVVWYRVRWHQTHADAPVGLLLEYVNMADEVWVNGSQLFRDPHLVEPLSRSWNTPQFFQIAKPLLHAGENILLVRVSGISHYRPGFGPVKIGPPEVVRGLYHHAMFWRYDIHLFNLSLCLVLGAVFGLFWLLRRKDTVYGWYALYSLFSAAYGWNYVSTRTWPFANTDARQAFFAAMFAAVVCSLAVFLLRFVERRWRRTEIVLGLLCVTAFACALFAPHLMGPLRNLWIIPAVAIYYGAIVVFWWHALRIPRLDVRVLGVCLLLPVIVSLHDLAVYLEWWRAGNGDIDALTSPLLIIGMGFAVAWRFSRAMRRVEGFNAELKRKVESATTQLADTLESRHVLALDHARVGERLNLVRDLHDGFGGSLVSAIVGLEQLPDTPETNRTIATLKGLRDDLRLVIHTTTQDPDTDLAGLLAPLQHRWNQRLDMLGIDCRWQLDGLAGLHLDAAHSLDLLRFVQEALTNVFKHSGGTRVDVRVRHMEDILQIEIRDDGRGFDRCACENEGAGLASLQTRAMRLGGRVAMDTSPGKGTSVRLEFPLGDEATRTPTTAVDEPLA